MLRVPRLRSTVILFMAMVMGALAAPAAGQDPQAILVLHTYGYDAPGRIPFDAAFSRALRGVAGLNADLYIETLDPNRFKGELLARQTRQYLRDKYVGRHITAVAAVFDEALAFLLDERDPVFPGVPVAALLTRHPQQALPDRVAVIVVGNTIGQSVALALSLNPKARQIAIIEGTPGSGREIMNDEAIDQVKALGLRIPIVPLHNLPLDELLPRVQALPPDGIIYLVRQYIGPRGEPISHDDSVREVARVAPAPLFVSTDTMIGNGALGGVVVPMEEMGTALAKLALRISEKGSQPIPPTDAHLVPMFDWREVQRWRLDQARLPADSAFLFRTPSIWDQYRWYVIGAVSVTLVEGALIAGLVVQRARRRGTEVALRESEKHFRVMADRAQDLAGRLISVQEEERTRIARDLHDDLSQQLAGLAIMLSGLRRKLANPEAALDVDLTLGTLQERTRALAQSVRDLSHQLHPSVLEQAGLGTTLRRQCADFGKLHQVNVIFSAEHDFETLSPDVALCLFRVAQEALTNVVRHARARTIHMQLMATPEGIELRVEDDGIGFVASEGMGSGLGLRSIYERVRLIRGQVTVQSQPGLGTKLAVKIPLSVERAAPDSTAPVAHL